jgi:hypothetical protein
VYRQGLDGQNPPQALRWHTGDAAMRVLPISATDSSLYFLACMEDDQSHRLHTIDLAQPNNPRQAQQIKGTVDDQVRLSGNHLFLHKRTEHKIECYSIGTTTGLATSLSLDRTDDLRDFLPLQVGGREYVLLETRRGQMVYFRLWNVRDSQEKHEIIGFAVGEDPGFIYSNGRIFLYQRGTGTITAYNLFV